MQQNQLNKANATINCTQCQKSFSVNQHLIVTPDTSNSFSSQHNTATAHHETQSKLSNRPESSTNSRNQASNISNTAKSSLHKKRSADILIHDDLIYDDMDIDEPEDSIVEYDSLDSMDAWLTQVSDTNAATTTDNATNTLSKTNTDRIATEHSSMTQEVLSSTAANDIHASINDTADDSWLENTS
ncbi:hypothetical protein PKHYL_27600 [Psychrobacter sp. KH172YL61]|uniref:hypothetical protein n=1 Tax=Psychrobacter sp. KH172YL61 TaxID=2517899 RepID=UPI0010B5F4A0|nr:hypothetical protein [Psychrobacter sp. KH172YL61]BBI68569.1 hypothetical protein PKHYL_27600 [Psychrobacter sp. KH172YL61]